jgi:hypothetical protein
MPENDPDEHDYSDAKETETEKQQEEIKEPEVEKPKVEEKKDASSGTESKTTDESAVSQRDPQAKSVVPGTTIAKQSDTSNIKQFQPKSGPSFLRRLRRPPIDVPTEGA